MTCDVTNFLFQLFVHFDIHVSFIFHHISSSWVQLRHISSYLFTYVKVHQKSLDTFAHTKHDLISYAFKTFTYNYPWQLLPFTQLRLITISLLVRGPIRRQIFISAALRCTQLLLLWHLCVRKYTDEREREREKIRHKRVFVTLRWWRCTCPY